MSSFRKALPLALMLLSADVFAEGFILGAGLEGDSEDGRAYTAFGDFSFSENTWLSVFGTLAETEGIIQDNDTMLAGANIDHFFGPIGVRIGGSYWGNADILDSRDFEAAIYIRGEPGSLSLDYERRNFEFDLQSDLLRGRTVEFSADGWGLTSRAALGENVSLFAGGMVYDYSRDLRIQPDIDVLAFISRSRLSMINNLIDHQFNGGIEFRFGLRSLDLTAGEWQTAIDGGRINSFSVGFLTPLGDRFDGEFRLSFDNSEFYGRTTAFSFYLYYFGGS